MIDLAAATEFASSSLLAVGDATKAPDMARYMKTNMPFYGVQKAGRVPILKELARRWPPDSRSEYFALVNSLWALSHREEKYLAIGVARAHDRFVTKTSVPLYRRLIIGGAWWDLVDEVAIKLPGKVLLRQRDTMTATVLRWLDHSDLWLRRSAIIAQVGHKDQTDVELLFHCCATRAHEPDFFIRKAIGWALRDFAWTEPNLVARFVADHSEQLSGLSTREATKNL